jgi:hypothetical protein
MYLSNGRLHGNSSTGKSGSVVLEDGVMDLQIGIVGSTDSSTIEGIVALECDVIDLHFGTI